MEKMGEMSFEEWVATVPERVKAEACWRFDAYPKALYLYELAWDDCKALMRDVRGRAVARQLIRISEGTRVREAQAALDRALGLIAEGRRSEAAPHAFRAYQILYYSS